MKYRKIVFHMLFISVLMLSAACGKKSESGTMDMESTVKISAISDAADIAGMISAGRETDEIKYERTFQEQALLDRLCEKVVQFYMVEPVETEAGIVVLVRERVLSDTPGVSDTAGEIVARYELPYKIRMHNIYNFYYDGEIFAVAEGAWSNEYPQEYNNALSILVSFHGEDFQRMEVGETEYQYQEVYFDFSDTGRIVLMTQGSIFAHEIFLRANSESDWCKLGASENFENCYNRLVSCISFFDSTTGVVGTPFVDPWYTNFIRTEDAGENWFFAEKELLEDMPDSSVSEECCYSVLSLRCEGNLGAALVRVADWETDGSYAFYLYTTEDKGKTWNIESKLEKSSLSGDGK